MNEKEIKAEVISLEDHRKHQQSIKYEIEHEKWQKQCHDEHDFVLDSLTMNVEWAAELGDYVMYATNTGVVAICGLENYLPPAHDTRLGRDTMALQKEIVHMHEKILSAFAHGLVESSDFDKDLLLKFFARQLDTALEKKRKISSH